MVIYLIVTICYYDINDVSGSGIRWALRPDSRMFFFAFTPGDPWPHAGGDLGTKVSKRRCGWKNTLW